MADTRRPIHLGVVVGVSASLYAVSLAVVTGLQSSENARIQVDHAPVVAAVDRLDVTNSDLEARLVAARAAFDVSAAAFSDVADQFPGFEARLRTLAGTVGRIQGSSVSLPSGRAIPRVSGAGSAAKPAVHTTTSASGH